jgi:gliding motility-associated-like protein
MTARIQSKTLIQHPKAGFTINDSSQCLNNHSFDLTNNTTLTYGTYTSNWLFDDATTDSGKDVSTKQFIKEYYHKIILTVNSQYGCTDTTQRWIYLEKPKSTTIQLADKDSQCLKGNRFGFSGISTDPGVSYTAYQWDFGNGNSSSNALPTHNYKKDGKMRVMLASISSNGCRDTGYLDVVILSQPLSSFTAGDTCFPDPIVFQNTSSISSGSIVSTYWDFGDGSTSTQLNPVKYYSIPKYYDVMLVSVSGNGCRDTLKVNNGAYLKAKPSAKFDFTTLPSKEFDLTSLQMNNKSSVDVVSHSWDFGNGTFSTDKDPIAEYRDSNSKMIQLVVMNKENCADTFILATGRMITDFFFQLPNAFSPNGSGLNDEFKPVASPYVRYYVMEIFNCWGEKVFESREIGKGWDGTYMGEPCEQGIYLCRIYVVPMKGKLASHELTVTLLR